MEKQRASPRLRTFKGGTISRPPAPNIDCTVRNLSATGACLEFKGEVGVPDTFSLVIKPENIRRDCRVAWRTQGRIGVRFT